jgi:hypothetical protein
MLTLFVAHCCIWVDGKYTSLGCGTAESEPMQYHNTFTCATGRSECLPSALTLTLAMPTDPFGLCPSPYWVPQSASGRPGRAPALIVAHSCTCNLGHSRSLDKTEILGVTVSRQDRDPGGHSPGTGPHVSVRHNRDSDAIHSNRSPWRIG